MGDAGTCDNFQDCPAGYDNKKDASKFFCSDQECTDTPWGGCCAPQGKCNTLECPAGTVLRLTASDLNCQGLTCDEATDKTTCCEPVQKCNLHTCSNTNVQLANAATVSCKAAKCTTADDEAECCEPKGPCSLFACPAGYDLVENHAKLLCADKDCSNSAMGKCCEPEAKCTSNTMQCPDGEVLREKAELLNCQGATCDQATDATTCCEPVAKCITHVCDSTTNVLRAKSMTIGCKALKCTTADDEAQCCVSKGNCLSLECPQGQLHLATAKDTRCVDELCKATPFDTCCGSTNQSKTMKCPTNYVLRVGSHDATCKSWECQEADEDDRDTCCDPVRMCSTHTCVS